MKIEINLNKAMSKLSQSSIRQGRYAVANQALSDMNQYVPMNEGSLRLSASIDIDGGGINYNTPYAKTQFYGTNGKATFSNYTTPGTGPRWDLKAKSIHMKDWEKAYMKGAGW